MDVPAIAKARSLLGLRRYREAEQTIRTHLTAHPHDAEALRLLSIAQHQQDQDREALKACVAANNLEPDHVGGLMLLANLHRKLGQQQLALDAATRAVRGAPHDWKTFYTRAHVQLAQPRPQPAGALSDSLKAVELAPNEPQTHNMLGMSYAALRKPERAQESYEASLALDPTNVWALNNLAVLRMNRGRLATASRQLRSGLALDPQQRLLHTNYDALLVRMLNRIWWLSTCLGVVETILLSAGASAAMRATAGMCGVVGIGGFAYHSRRWLPGYNLGSFLGLWTRVAGPTQILMIQWGVTGLCALLTCFAPKPAAQPAGIVLISVAAGLALARLIRQVQRSRTSR